MLRLRRWAREERRVDRVARAAQVELLLPFAEPAAFEHPREEAAALLFGPFVSDRPEELVSGRGWSRVRSVLSSMSIAVRTTTTTTAAAAAARGDRLGPWPEVGEDLVQSLETSGRARQYRYRPRERGLGLRRGRDEGRRGRLHLEVVEERVEIEALLRICAPIAPRRMGAGRGRWCLSSVVPMRWTKARLW